MGSVPSFTELLETHRAALLRFLEHHGRGLARYESADDLLQGVHLHALRVQERFVYQGEPAAYGWLCALARQHIARRHAHWKALKRQAGPLLRVTYGGARGTAEGSGIVLAANQRGPATWATLREHVDLAVRALHMLPERDRRLIELLRDGADIDATAAALELTPGAAQRARLRAQERFRKVFELLLRGGA